ncbi:MAG: S-layer protein, could be associated with type IV pili like system [Candidatus Methanohalarchaeum thermophilum]|uniref:S-layer protein, could be associated with type IV pili like system n=1 Tax=Methanohalarchaeum thermophilum TaxID=1903181 RepID=A0A1Q6DWK5_METT1|nr:MAG: S-layer protein, could be associated with type IV pili like system [Candidatus Methanohalarchaeum thermophilum]
MNSTKKTIILTLILASIFLVVISPQAKAAAYEVAGNPEIKVYAPENNFSAGKTLGLQVYLNNEGEITDDGVQEYEQIVKTAENPVVNLKSGDAPVIVHTDKMPIQDIRPGLNQPISFKITLKENAKPGQYQLPLIIDYSHKEKVYYGSNQIPGRSFTVKESRDVSAKKMVDITIREEANFKVVDVSNDIPIGDSGQVNLKIKNIGTEKALNSTIDIRSSDPAFSLGKSLSTNFHIKSWDVNETKTLSFKAYFSEDAILREYPISANILFEDINHIKRSSKELKTHIIPKKEQRFNLETLSSSLRVGEEGSIHAAITNNGPLDTENCVILFNSQNPNLTPKETQAYIGDLGQNKTKEFNFTIDVSSNSQRGIHQITFNLKYEKPSGDQRLEKNLNLDAVFKEKQTEFSIEPVENQVRINDEAMLKLKITNNMDQVISNVQPMVYTDSPLSSDNDNAFIEKMEPGESEVVTMDISADSTAIDKKYPVTIDISYEEEDGDTKLSDLYRFPVDVQPKKPFFITEFFNNILDKINSIF